MIHYLQSKRKISWRWKKRSNVDIGLNAANSNRSVHPVSKRIRGPVCGNHSGRSSRGAEKTSALGVQGQSNNRSMDWCPVGFVHCHENR